MCDVNKDIFIEQQVRKPMEVPVTKPQDPLEVNEIIKGPLILENLGRYLSHCLSNFDISW